MDSTYTKATIHSKAHGFERMFQQTTKKTGIAAQPAGHWMTVRTAVAAVITVVLISGGCVIPRHRGIVPDPPPGMMGPRITQHFPANLYRLAEGDTMEFLYLTVPQKTPGPYKLSIKDSVDVEFAFHPELNRTVRVRPDGRISIPRKPDVMVAGMTSEQASDMLKQVYADLLREPEITVTVREFNAKLDELQKAIATAPYGQARVVAIRPDGNISLPFIPDIRASGLTLPEITRVVNKQYASIIADMQVSVLLKDVVGNLVFIDGEVNRPGVFNMRGPLTVQQAIAMAGGTKSTAEPRTVLLLSKAPDGSIAPRTVDLTAINATTDYTLGRDDLVYVPRSTIAKANIWVDQNVKGLLMFQGWSLGLSGAFGRQGSR
jgi:polysaccharide export outer membrane protein